ncbi:MAG TPA: apolipoprotein N-acyltransferase [Arenicellales bacterium]|nr:apolipoprotein N-acyltransferase [Arenicellales bacterium]
MRQLLAAAAAGGIGVLGFGPIGQFWAVLLSAAALLWLWWDATPRRAAWLGFAWGAGLFGIGVSWVYVSMHVYGHMPPWMAVVVVIVFVAILSLYPALVGWVFRRWLARRALIGALAGLPALWALAEWVRGWALSGFPWLSLGYSQVDSWLSGWSPVLGVYGVSWLVMLTAALAVAALRRGLRPWWAAAVAVAVWGGGLGMGQVRWAEPQGDPLEVALVQGNVSLDRKWDADERPRILNRYLSLSNHLEDRDLVVWPESALPYFIHEVDNRIWESMRRHPADFVLGMLESRTDGRSVRTYNSVVAITEDDPQLYRKVHLVPFGEYLPLEPLFGWVIDYLKIPMSDFDAWDGPEQGPLQAAGTGLGMTVCYEDAFPEETIKPLPAAGVLVNVSEDAWFGDSLAPHQRIQMARMRAMESARPMLRAANTGVSAIIDHRGRLTASSQQFVATVVKGPVQPMQGATPFVRWGNAGIVVLSVALIALTLLIGWRSVGGQPPGRLRR